jgi:hypothetical protein
MQTMRSITSSQRGVLAAAVALAAFGATAQEIQGGAAPTGSPVPKSIAVSQAKLDAADKDGANFLHSNMNYVQRRTMSRAALTDLAKTAMQHGT